MRGIICDTDPAVRDEAPQAYKDLGQARLRGLDGLGPEPRVWGFCVGLRFGSKIWRLGLGVWGSGCATWLCISKGMVFPNPPETADFLVRRQVSDLYMMLIWTFKGAVRNPRFCSHSLRHLYIIHAEVSDRFRTRQLHFPSYTSEDFDTLCQYNLKITLCIAPIQPQYYPNRTSILPPNIAPNITPNLTPI